MEDEIIDQEEVGSNQPPGKLLKTRVLLIWIGLLAVGLIFRGLSWKGGAILILGSSAGLSAYAFTALLVFRSTLSLYKTLNILGIMWFACLIWGVLYNAGHPFNMRGVKLYVVVFVTYAIGYGVWMYRGKRAIAKWSDKSLNQR